MSNVVQCYEYETFAMLVGSRGKRGYSLAVIQSPVGDVHAFCRLDPKASPLPEMLSALENGQANEATLQQLGDLLFHALFTGDLASAYHASLSKVRGQNKQLRVRLIIEPPELATLPWEFLYDAQEDAFLSISSETAIVRYVPIPLPVHPTTVTPPFRLLVAAAAPHNVQALDATHELSIVQAALAEWTTNGVVQLQCVNHATVAKVSEAMRQFRPHAFHFVGHASFTQEQGCLLLENEDGSARPVNERTFREFFVGCPDTRLVVLNACQTATTSVRQPLVGMAPRLLQRQLSAVVAMQYPIADTTSLIFTRAFYRALALGYPLEAAIAEARRGIYLEVGGQTLEWGTPVLFLRAEDGQLFQVNHTEPRQSSTEQMDTPTGLIALDGDFVRRDKIIQGDEVHGDQIAGNKTEVHIERVEPGAQVIIGDPQITQAPPLEIPPPPEPAHPPVLTSFVGREIELAYYAERLQTMRCAVVCGMAGVGKSMLAAVLAERVASPDKIFWHSFHAGEGFEPVLWELAGFLASHGENELWQMLHTAWQTRKQLLPPATLFNYLIQLLRGQAYLICLDDFQFVDADPLVEQLLERLQTLLTSGELSLIITARRLPNFISTTEFAPLNGLSFADTRALLAARHLALSDPLIADLHTKTEGNAQLLTLAIEALRHTTNPVHLMARLVETDDIERYLMHEVDEGLSSTERAVMSAVAILLGYFGTREAIEAIVGGDNLRRTLHNLSNRYLLVPRETELGRVYGQHATLQAFYYDLLCQRERVAMHQRAGDYYTHEETDALSAARHYQYAGDFWQAAEVVVPALWTIINQGQGQVLRQILDRFTSQQLDAPQWAQVNIVRGQLHTLLGESALAHQCFESALECTVVMPESPARHKLRSAVYEGKGRLLEHESPQQALAWLQRGLDELAGSDDQEAATALRIRIGSAQSAGSEYAEALQSLQQGLAQLAAAPSALRTSALIDIGNIYAAQGDLSRGHEYYTQALAIAEQLHDNFTVLAIRSNLAIDKEIAGDWPGAIDAYHQALALAERLGDVVEQTKLTNSLGNIYTKLGDDQAARTHLTRAIDLARLYNNREDLLYALISLADLHVRLGEVAAAEAPLTEAESLAGELAIESMQAEIAALWAQIYLQRGDPQRALAYAQQAVNNAHGLGLKAEEGKFLRVFGQVQTANQQREQAVAAMEQSLALLADHDPYEAACTQMAWGQTLLLNGAMAQGQGLLQKAITVFRELGAKRDLLAAEQYLPDTTGAAV